MRLPATEPAIAAPGGFRRWLRSDMRVLRWVFLVLYGLILLSLLVISIHGNDAWPMLVALGVCRPIRRRRLLVPVITSGAMIALLVGGLFIAMWELLYLDKHVGDELAAVGFFAAVGLSWIGWGVLLFNRLKYRPRHTILSRLTTYIFAGSLAELLATVPSHIIVSRRPGCLVGIGTMLGIIAGVSVMLFSFGPAIVLLFLRPRLRAEQSETGVPYCPACGYDLRASKERCPECGLPVGESSW
jgi:hypothetical protein